MTSLNEILYILGTNSEPMTTMEIAACTGEKADKHKLHNRVRTFLTHFSIYFLRSGEKRPYKFNLSSDGKKKFEKIRYTYDPVAKIVLE